MHFISVPIFSMPSDGVKDYAATRTEALAESTSILNPGISAKCQQKQLSPSRMTFQGVKS